MRELIVLGGIIGFVIYWIIKLIFNRKNIDIGREITKSIFTLYIIFVLALTFGKLMSFYAVTFHWTFNMIPLNETILMFRNNLGIALYQVGGNIIMFIPFGIFVPILYKREKNIFRVGGFSFLFSLLIEV